VLEREDIVCWQDVVLLGMPECDEEDIVFVVLCAAATLVELEAGKRVFGLPIECADIVFVCTLSLRSDIGAKGNILSLRCDIVFELAEDRKENAGL